jgi:5'-nucleotidase
MARAASVIGQWKRTEPNPILLHAGDFMVGSLMFNAYFGVPELLLLEGLGFDALVLGNHEFDAGPSDLGDILATTALDSAFQIISCNALNAEAVPSLDSIMRPYAIEQRGNLKVGIIGLTTPATNVNSNPLPVFLDTNLVQVAMQAVGELQVQDCQVIVVLSHLGKWLDMQIAEFLSGVDAIIGGHSHSAATDVIYVNDIPLVQAGEFYHYVGKLRLLHSGGITTVLDYTLLEIDETIPAEPTTDATIQQLKLGIISQYSPVIGDPYQIISYTPTTLNAYPQALDTLDTPTGNLFTSAMLDYVNQADCAMEPNGHIVEELYQGDVTPADLFRIYPYGYDDSDDLGFRLANFDLTGMEIMGIMQALLDEVNPQIGDWDFLPQSSGLTFEVYSTDQGLLLNSINIGGAPIDPMANYTLVSSDRVVSYLQELFQITPAKLNIHSISVFQVMKEYVEAMDTIDVTTGHNFVGL